MRSTLSPYLTTGIAVVGAGIVAVTPVAPPPDVQTRAVQLTDITCTAPCDVGLVVGGSGTPIPQLNDDYVTNATTLYIDRVSPGVGDNSTGVFTPEGLSPIYTGVKSLPLDTSVDQGRYMLDSYIQNQVTAGNTVTVYGESQSSTISGFVMTDLQNPSANTGNTEVIPPGDVKFVLVGDPSNPDGGLLERLDGLTLPAMGITFSGATPPDTVYDTTIYTQEYDGFADFPKYPLNFLSDLNAFLGIQYVHPTYQDLTSGQIGAADPLGTFDNTTYYMIPMSDQIAANATMPLLRPLELLPVVGQPLADLLQPDMRVLVNLGYDNPDPLQGWDSGSPNVPTQFGVLPPLDQVITKLEALGPGTVQGIENFVGDLSHLSLPSLSSLNPLSALSDLASGSGASLAALSPTGIVNALTAAFSEAYSILLPTADIATSLAITMPTYDLTLFLDNLTNPLDAIGLPLGADTALVTLAGGIEFMVLEQTATSIIADLTSAF